MSFNYTEILTPGTIILIGLLLIGLIRLIAKKFLSKAEIETLMLIGSIAVEGAEQLAKIGQLAPEERYRMALDLIIKEMSARGFNPSPKLVATAIEAAVMIVNNSKMPVFEVVGEEEQTIE